MSGMPLLQNHQPQLHLVPPPEPKPDSSIIKPFSPSDIVDDVIDYYPYQQETIADILNGFLIEKIRRQRVIMATGLGKTIVFNAVMKILVDMDYRALLLTHRTDLLNQADDKMQKIGLAALIEQGNNRALTHFFGERKIVIASVQTLHPERARTWDRNAFDFIFHDEAHHIRPDNNNHWWKLVRYFQGQHLGVTATPGYDKKIDGKRKYIMIPGWDRDIEKIKMLEATEQGYLAPLVFRKIKTNIDLRGIGKTFGEDSDFKQTELDRVIYANTNKLATIIRDNVGDRRGIVFTPLVASAEALSSAFNDIGIKAKVVSGETKFPKEIYDAHERGEFQLLVNCAKCIEGYDAPYLETVVLANPTKSTNRYRQCVGRGTRTFYDKETGYRKQDCLVIDFTYITDVEEALVGGAEYLKEKLTDYEEEDVELILKAADEFMNSDEDVTLDEALESAKKTVEEQKESERIAEEIRAREAAAIEARRLKNKEQQSRYEVTTFKIGDCNLLGIPEHEMNDLQHGEDLTPKQASLIEKMTKGRIKTEGMKKSAATRIIGQLMEDRENGKASYGQRHVMTKRLGAHNITDYEAQNLTFEDAKEYISMYKTW